MEAGSDEKVKRRFPVKAVFGLGLVAGMVWLFFAFLESERIAFAVSKASTHRALALNWLEYAGDNDDRACPVEKWRTALLPYYQFRDRLGTESPGSGASKFDIGLNPAVGGIQVLALANAEQLPVFVNTTLTGYHAWARKDSIKRVFAGRDTVVWASADAKAQRSEISELRSMSWEPIFVARASAGARAQRSEISELRSMSWEPIFKEK